VNRRTFLRLLGALPLLGMVGHDIDRAADDPFSFEWQLDCLLS